MIHTHGDHTRHRRTRPWQRLSELLRLERSDLLTLLAFARGVGLLSIVVPAAIEALVNTVAFGVLLWPVFVLSLVMFTFLFVAAVMRALQILVAECLQRRLFVRTADAFARHFARAEMEAFDGRNPTDIVNRFLWQNPNPRFPTHTAQPAAELRRRPGAGRSAGCLLAAGTGL